jgi:hypothetical protein
MEFGQASIVAKPMAANTASYKKLISVVASREVFAS